MPHDTPKDPRLFNGCDEDEIVADARAKDIIADNEWLKEILAREQAKKDGIVEEQPDTVVRPAVWNRG